MVKFGDFMGGLRPLSGMDIAKILIYYIIELHHSKE